MNSRTSLQKTICSNCVPTEYSVPLASIPFPITLHCNGNATLRYYDWNAQATFPEISICPIKFVIENAIMAQENINWLRTQLPKIRQLPTDTLNIPATYAHCWPLIIYEECRKESALQHTAKGCTLKAVVVSLFQVLI